MRSGQTTPIHRVYADASIRDDDSVGVGCVIKLFDQNEDRGLVGEDDERLTGGSIPVPVPTRPERAEFVALCCAARTVARLDPSRVVFYTDHPYARDVFIDRKSFEESSYGRWRDDVVADLEEWSTKTVSSSPHHKFAHHLSRVASSRSQC